MSVWSDSSDRGFGWFDSFGHAIAGVWDEVVGAERIEYKETVAALYGVVSSLSCNSHVTLFVDSTVAKSWLSKGFCLQYPSLNYSLLHLGKLLKNTHSFLDVKHITGKDNPADFLSRLL